MILLDTSILVAFLRGKDAKVKALLKQHPAATCWVARAKILHGARDAADRGTLLVLLNSLPHVPMPESLWDDVGDMLAALRSKGLTVNVPDAVIATLAISNGMPLWTRDNDFTLIQQVRPALQLFAEPP
jgi:predicted nucleic acid-binding protein